MPVKYAWRQTASRRDVSPKFATHNSFHTSFPFFCDHAPADLSNGLKPAGANRWFRHTPAVREAPWRSAPHRWSAVSCIYCGHHENGIISAIYDSISQRPLTERDESAQKNTLCHLEHGELIEAFKRHDPVQARRSMERHLGRKIKKTYSDALSGSVAKAQVYQV